MKKEQGYDEFKKLTLGERFKRIHLDKEIRDFIRNFNITKMDSKGRIIIPTKYDSMNTATKLSEKR